MRAKILAVVTTLALTALIESASIENNEGSSQITVTSLGGKPARVHFDGAHDTVARLKAKIAELNGGHIANLRLIYAGRVLEDDRLLSEYGIQPDSKIVYLEHANSSPSLSNGDTSAGQREEGLPITHLDIRTDDGRASQVSVERNMSIGALKRAIAIKREVPVNEVRLTHNGIVLEDDSKTLESSNRAESVESTNQELDPIEQILNENLNDSMLDQPMFQVTLKHKAEYVDPHEARRAIEGVLVPRSLIESPFGPFVKDILDSEDLLIDFEYEFQGQRRSNRANLEAGARWVSEQARALSD